MAKNILVVDKTSFNRSIIKNNLSKAGYNIVAEAGDGRKAIEQFIIHSPDLVVMEIQLPEADGIEALKAMRAINPDVPVIMCSASGQQTKVLEAVKAGAKDFLVKPIQPDRLIDAVRECIG